MASTSDQYYYHLPYWLVMVYICAIIPYTQQFSENGLNESMTTEHGSLDGEKARSKRLLITPTFRHWPNGVIPYKFMSVDEKNGRDILGAMAVYEYLTPLRFVPWEKSLVRKLGHVGFMKVQTTYGRGYSLLGFHNDSNGQWMDCPHLLTCIHEIGHALGFQHEQYHPERDKWLRVNKQNLFEFDTWLKLGWGSYKHTHFDISTVMLYGPNYLEPFDILFPELKFEPRYFYMLREFCLVYECDKYPQCRNHRLKCANEGFVSVVSNKCACVCPRGLDPDSQCMNMLKTKTSNWPSGTFSLLQHKNGCPSGSFRTGLWRHFGTGRNKKQSDTFKGDLSDPKAEFSFCTQTNNDNRKKWWPPGAYCFPKRGTCPKQTGFEDAKIIIPGRGDTSKNVYQGYLPTGATNKDATLEFCCSHAGFSYIPAIFPSTKPFILFALKDYNCQEVAGMHVQMEKFSISGAKLEGELRHSREGNEVYFNYCVYTPLNRDCGGVIEMGPNKRTFTIESDQNNPTFRECTWLFKSTNKKDFFVLAFDDFNVKSSKTKCDNNVEVQPTMIAQKGTLYCDQRKDKSIQSMFGQMLVRFRNGNANSYFKATVKWVPEKEMCYDPKDSGWTYRGTVNYTRKFVPCLPWTQVTSCLHHSYRVGDYLDGLEENYCRNPDDSFRPWCYTKLDGCRRDFCDVCHLEKPFDRSDNCTDRKRNGLCMKDDTDCAESCNIIPTSIKLGTDVHCNQPGTVSGGEFEGPTKQRYNLGDKVTFKCRKSGNTIERTCLSTGKWTTANTACLPCPLGFHHFQHSCYKFYFKFLTVAQATAECGKVGAMLAMPKTKEENDFVDSIRYRLNTVWLGARRDNKGVYKWNDGTTVETFFWMFYDVPHVDSCVYLSITGLWRSTDAWDWKFNFVCQKPVTDDKPDCKDFLDNCPNLVSSVPGSNCDSVPGLGTYCRHTCGLCPRDCDQQIEVSKASPEYRLSSDRRQNPHRYCTWIIKAPNKEGRFVFQFNEFQVKAVGDECLDSIEVKPSEYGPPYTRYCDTNYTRSLVIDNDELMVKFRTPGTSSSHFKATVKWIPDSDMCYSLKDKGRSYIGRVNYTETFKPCLSWSEALNCVNNTLQYGSFLDGLEDNYCRNHDGSNKPWCYDEQCEKQYCDVCHLVIPSDNSSDCQKFKNDGKCATDLSRAATECAETCKATLQGTKTKVSDITCTSPRYISGGTMQTKRRTFHVGQKVKFRCSKNRMFVKKTCLTSGNWSTANTACLECPFGFIPLEQKCYRYFKVYQDKAGAQKHCLKYGAVIAAPKDSEENGFVSTLRGEERIWLGGKKGTDAFEWNDGTKFTWSNWFKAKKSFSSRDDCVVLEKNEKWTDDWCKKKLFYFVCQADRQIEQADCKDYLDICPSLLQSVPESNCDPYPSLQVYCRSSCGLCSQDCKREIRLTSRNPMSTIIANSNTGQKLCTWSFEGDDTEGRFILTLDYFNVNGPDSLTIKQSQIGDVLHTYSGRDYQPTLYVDKNKLFLSFKTSANSNSRFKATVKWIRDSDMCYRMKDKGWSYNGNVNYTMEFQPCLPWAELLKCPHNPLKDGDFQDNLDGNYCRNPDGSDQPWCYTGQCVKKYCDVCHLENPADRSNDCGQRKNSGLCSKDSIDCAQTCQIGTAMNINKVSDTQCGPPGQISGGTIQGVTKSQYDVGEKVVYTCTKSSFPMERVCLSSGDWSVANTACLACPSGFSPFKGNCYKFIQKGLGYADAVKECKMIDSLVATPKSLEENTFIHSLSLKSERSLQMIWLGAQKNEREGNFFWADNTPFSWTYWVIREPFRAREKCVLMQRSQRWDDDRCRVNKWVIGFVCEQKQDDKPGCKDFLDSCPRLLSMTKKSSCDSDSHMEIFCRYTCGLCPRDCDRKIKLSRSKPTYLIRGDRRQRSKRYCTWNFQGDSEHGRFALLFKDFDVKSSGTECEDVVEISRSLYGSSQRYCNGNEKQFVEMMSNKMVVKFRTPGASQSYIRISVKWIDDSDMCYNEKDKGWSYDGKVSYTVNFQPCLQWSQALKCPHNPLAEKNFLDNLEGNYCRNPDRSDKPWCYVGRCEKQYCDVCNLGNLRDVSRNCNSFKASGLCTSDLPRALKECAVTCQLVSQQTLPKVRDIQCRRSRIISGATLVGRRKSYYKVGEMMTFKCSSGTSQVDRTCLTSGQWSVAKTACLECPVGWVSFGNKCYLYVNQFIQRPDAELECKRLSAKLANAKSMDVVKFMSKFCPKDDMIWLGVSKSKITSKFTWSDGRALSWTNWRNTGKKDASREDCVLMNGRGRWFDDWCNNKYYSFVCQMDKDDSPACTDFVDTCPKLVQLKENNQCDSVLNKFCRRTCGQCTNG